MFVGPGALRIRLRSHLFEVDVHKKSPYKSTFTAEVDVHICYRSTFTFQGWDILGALRILEAFWWI